MILTWVNFRCQGKSTEVKLIAELFVFSWKSQKGIQLTQKQAQKSLAAAISLIDISGIATSWADCSKTQLNLQTSVSNYML